MTTLLIDGDILAFIAAAAAQRTVGNPQVDDSGAVYAFASLPEGIAIMENTLSRLISGLGATGFRIALSDADNWRKAVLPSYKSNRDELQRPVLLGHLKQYLVDTHHAKRVGGLEADDLIGIWATEPIPGELGWHRIEEGGEVGRAIPVGSSRPLCVSRDKDFRGIPGFHHTLGDTDSKGNLRVVHITPWQAKRFHLVQALSGDRVDGYGGCPGLGMARAERIIDDPQRLVPKPGIITAGKNKGKPVTRWYAEPTDDYWACIVSHYMKAGLGEAEALVTARVAKILLYEDYEAATETIRLWTPERIKD